MIASRVVIGDHNRRLVRIVLFLAHVHTSPMQNLVAIRLIQEMPHPVGGTTEPMRLPDFLRGIGIDNPRVPRLPILALQLIHARDSRFPPRVRWWGFRRSKGDTTK